MYTIRDKEITAILVMSCTIVVIIAVLLLILVWTTDRTEPEEVIEYSVGVLDTRNQLTADDYVKKYFSIIESKLTSEDYDAIYGYLAEDYVKSTGMTKEKLKNYLKSRKIVGQPLVLKSYENTALVGYSNIYIMNINQKDGIYDLNVVLKEKSPNNFTIAFDEFIDEKTNQLNAVFNSVNLSVDRVTRYSNYIEFEITVKNLYDEDIILNSQKQAECIYLKLADNSIIAPFGSVLGGTKLTLRSQRSKTYIVKYRLENKMMNSIQSLVIKDIYYEGKNITSDAEFTF